MSYKKIDLKVIMVVIMLLLIFLNLLKYHMMSDVVVPVWSSHDVEYYDREKDNRSLITRVKDYLSPEQLLYRLTRIRVRAPITYLKREIPLLAYYTPEELKTPRQVVYNPGDNNKIVKLKFDLRQGEEISSQQDNSQSIDDLRGMEPDNKIRDDQKRPLIAIYHTHTSETYIDDPRKQDNNGHVFPGEIGNVARVGSELATLLAERYNFRVIHTTKVHDERYSMSYYNSRKTVKELLDNNPEIDLLLDIHRDGIKHLPSRETITTVVNDQRVAKVMIVVTNGKFDFAHLDLKDHHQEWEKNLNYARRFANKIEEMYPGLLSRLEIRDTTYNQDLHPRALLLEIGDYRNTTQEAIRSAELLAGVIVEMFR
ncbi:hypothetical protein GM661_08145 [Iocasia frigidifontis]|uniref:Stage II sporulation protein P n=1 Tax=Iocasia fonsfrigidae TaxID=2682810 RepID=A0A8A7K908_9FIRM|nr:stage II sporulation protein P [Iocasia fonsfrigidae]QTL97951.1 hypothetical protein GM661_08145 [Iocasia fonsfrigidae]